MVNPAGIISTLAGSRVAGGNDARVAARPPGYTLNNPTGVALDGRGHLYIGDAHNNVVLKMNLAVPAEKIIPLAAVSPVPSAAVVSPAPIVQITRQNGSFRLSWPVGPRLLTAPSLTGPWLPLKRCFQPMGTTSMRSYWAPTSNNSSVCRNRRRGVMFGRGFQEGLNLTAGGGHGARPGGRPFAVGNPPAYPGQPTGRGPPPDGMPRARHPVAKNLSTSPPRSFSARPRRPLAAPPDAPCGRQTPAGKSRPDVARKNPAAPATFPFPNAAGPPGRSPPGQARPPAGPVRRAHHRTEHPAFRLRINDAIRFRQMQPVQPAASAVSPARSTIAICAAPSSRHCASKWPMIVDPRHGRSSLGVPIRTDAPAPRMITPTGRGVAVFMPFVPPPGAVRC